ncbi:MAG: methyltransferase domain-containing protein [Alphaproteobacteria bacterium]|nr:methyltransferase domain-containing protein [Alphaproteobacteria bacterium]
MTPVPSPIMFDRARVTRNRDRASSRFREYAFLKGRESTQLLERLNDTSREFERALDIGAHDGQACEALRESGKVKQIIALESAPSMLAKLQSTGFETAPMDEEKLPFPEASFDLATSVLSLHWINDLPGVLTQVRRVLAPDGLFLACLFGGGTLSELRAAMIEAESEIAGGISPRLSPLPGLQDMAGLLQRAGFALPVADVERVTVRYSHPMKLLEDLKGMGEQAAFAPRDGQERRPLSRRILARMSEIYKSRFSDPDGKVRATFEIIWLSGWAPHESQPKPLRPGSGRFSLADAVKRARDGDAD